MEIIVLGRGSRFTGGFGPVAASGSMMQSGPLQQFLTQQAGWRNPMSGATADARVERAGIATVRVMGSRYLLVRRMVSAVDAVGRHGNFDVFAFGPLPRTTSARAILACARRLEGVAALSASRDELADEGLVEELTQALVDGSDHLGTRALVPTDDRTRVVTSLLYGSARPAPIVAALSTQDFHHLVVSVDLFLPSELRDRFTWSDLEVHPATDLLLKRLVAPPTDAGSGRPLQQWNDSERRLLPCAVDAVGEEAFLALSELCSRVEKPSEQLEAIIACASDRLQAESGGEAVAAVVRDVDRCPQIPRDLHESEHYLRALALSGAVKNWFLDASRSYRSSIALRRQLLRLESRNPSLTALITTEAEDVALAEPSQIPGTDLLNLALAAGGWVPGIIARAVESSAKAGSDSEVHRFLSVLLAEYPVERLVDVCGEQILAALLANEFDPRHSVAVAHSLGQVWPLGLDQCDSEYRRAWVDRVLTDSESSGFPWGSVLAEKSDETARARIEIVLTAGSVDRCRQALDELADFARSEDAVGRILPVVSRWRRNTYAWWAFPLGFDRVSPGAEMETIQDVALLEANGEHLGWSNWHLQTLYDLVSYAYGAKEASLLEEAAASLARGIRGMSGRGFQPPSSRPGL